MSTLLDILEEWDGGCFYSTELLAEAYSVALLALFEATPEKRADPRVIPFLEAGYAADCIEQDGLDTQAELCLKHYPPPMNGTENRLERTKRITALLRADGYTVIEKWECEFQSDLVNNPEVKAYFERHPTTRSTPLRLRDALSGGRTSALRWYHKADLDKGEKIKLYDVSSEYPNANLRSIYCLGHPTIYLEGDPNVPPLDQWNEVAKITILPPRDLYLPVLGYKAKGRLMFPLCRSCVEEDSQELCRHEEPDDRKLTGTWCSPEIKMAVQKGYKIISLHELYNYSETMQYDPATGKDGLLSAYVRCFMGLKIQASGWPPHCDSEEKKKQYIEDVRNHDGISVDASKVEKNPALRTLSKLILNSFWGKFGEKTLRTKTVLIYNYEELMGLVSDPTKTVQSLIPLSEDCLQVAWKPVEDGEESLPTSCLLHAAYTTCHGRLQLYQYLDIVQERALYFDTDSICFISRENEPEPPLGNHLGDLTDQIEEEYGKGSFITEFVAGGPKNYSYKVAVGGDTKNIKSDRILTYPFQDRLPDFPLEVVTRPARKLWQAKNVKRRRVDVARTVPHGFNAYGDEDEEDQDLLEALDLLME
ncbi:uncharacterized protein LOC117650752 [Thrips palmi]|uniref:DNA-directed DNA polymerase n=1 Tax=Thrips palmi TaxID=161013 RepID=A0A6P8ZYN4_THRPL|nr:uncharacterized protein LOC117650752 [Thrips palmi]